MTTQTVVRWPGGYTEGVRITNTGGAAVSGWKVTFGFPARERVTAIWNATRSQRGETVVARPVWYDKTIAAGSFLPFGFNAAGSGAAAPPTWYDLNGVRCKSVA